jgi:hypothetical protein
MQTGLITSMLVLSGFFVTAVSQAEENVQQRQIAESKLKVIEKVKANLKAKEASGTVEAETIFLWNDRWARCKMELAATHDEKIKFAEQVVLNAKKRYELQRQKFNKGLADDDAVSEAEFQFLEAEQLLIRTEQK